MVGGVFPEAGDPEPFIFGVLKEVGDFMSDGTGPFVVGGNGDEAASFGNGVPPHRAVEIVAAGVVDGAEALALKAPAHGLDFAGW